jgi:site-specific recombinase XerD
LSAADASTTPARNQAILALLLDTGCRASELVAMRHKDFDLANGRCQVLGKGNKYRTLFFGKQTASAVARYMATAEGEPESPLFPPTRGTGPFTRSGLLQLVKRLGETAGIKDAVTVHAMRRSFAVQMLRNGANVFSVQAMLGHSTLQQTRKYCALALADSEAQHRQFSPMDRLQSNNAAAQDA